MKQTTHIVKLRKRKKLKEIEALEERVKQLEESIIRVRESYPELLEEYKHLDRA